jgi:hypothetical protein
MSRKRNSGNMILYLMEELQQPENKTLITSWSRCFLEKPTGSQLVKKFPTFYGTAFTSTRHLSIS